MHGYIERSLQSRVREDLSFFPIVAILGARQCGKSTLARALSVDINQYLSLDLESPADLNKLQEPELFFEANRDKTICLDEIQRKPELFPVLRSIVDSDPRPGKILILGSATPDLIRQSSETLAGRISYTELTPFTINEIARLETFSLQDFWIRGGFPRSYLAPDLKFSKRWRENYIRTFVERDIPQLGFNISADLLRRFLVMAAHSSGQVFNFSKLGESLGVSYHTVRRYLQLFSDAFLLRVLEPYFSNTKKRLIKNPKVYVRDCGLLHTLLNISNFNDLLSHPVLGFSWETVAIENILSELPEWQGYYYRTSNGAEIDLLLVKGQQKLAIEFKVSSAPKLSRGFLHSISDLGIKNAYCIAPINETYPVKHNVTVCGLEWFINNIRT